MEEGIASQQRQEKKTVTPCNISKLQMLFSICFYHKNNYIWASNNFYIYFKFISLTFILFINVNFLMTILLLEVSCYVR